MIKEGLPHNLVRLTIDARLLEAIYDTHTVSLTKDEIERLADLCLANEWIEWTVVMGGGRYASIQLTTMGVGVVRSKRKQRGLQESKNLLIKASEYIEAHKGLFVLIGSLVALISLIYRMYKE